MAQKYPYIDDTHNPSSNPFHSILNDFDQFGVSASSDFHISGIATFSGQVNISGSMNVVSGLKDSSGDLGNSGQILSSTGSGVNWINANNTSVDNASKVGVNENSTDASQWVTFVGAKSGNNPIRVDDDLRYNPSTNVLTTGGVDLGNNSELRFGDDQALIIKHFDPGHSYIQQGAGKGDLVISTAVLRIVNAADNADLANFTEGSAVKLYNSGTLRLETTGTGVDVTGHLEISSGLDAKGDVDLGTNADNTVTFNADIDSALIPKTTQSHSLGANGAEWDNLWVKDINVSGSIKDKNGGTGTSGQVLSSTGTQVDWINVGNIAAGSASQVALSDDNNTDADRFIIFADSGSGNNALKTDVGLKYNPSTNLIASQITDVSNHTSDDISEGSNNLYFTNARARASISASGDLSYNSSTGVLSFSSSNSTFTGLTDTPANYTSQADKWVKVKSDASGLEFTDAPAGSFTGLTDTPANYTGHGTKLVAVKSDASGLEYVAAGTGADIDTFLELTDTPGTFTASKFVKVNSAGTALEFGDDNDTTYSVVTASDDGLAPHLPGAHGGKFLKADASWEVPPDTTYNLSIPNNTTAIRLAGSDSTNDDITITGGTNVTVTRTSGTEFTLSSTDTNTTYSVVTTSSDGLAPSLPSPHGGKFLKADGSWQVPAYTTDTWRGIDTSPTSGATTDSISSSWAFTHASSEGNSGHVPSVGSAGQFLKHDGTWGIPPNTTYSSFSGSSPGLVPDGTSAGNTKFLRSDGSWQTVSGGGGSNITYDLSVPSGTTKIRLAGSDSTNDDITITGGTNVTVTRTSGTQITLSSTDTTYSSFSGTTAGLVPNGTSAGSTKFLRSDGSWQTVTATESDTLATVTGRGSSTSTSCTFQNDFTIKANNKMFRVQNASGTNKFTVDTDNGTTSILGSGTPTIESPSGGNLNITATTATFSQNVHVTGNLTVNGTSPGGATDKIEEGNTSAEVVDSGSGYFKVVIDGTERFRIQSGTSKNGNVLLKRTLVNGYTEGGHLQFEDSQAVESFAIDVYGSTSANSVLRFLDQATGVQRFCMNRSGALGIGNVGSEDYGTSGEVLVSQGSGTPPKWDSISSSDARDKTDVEDFKYGLSWIKELRPITYRWDKRTWYGTEEEPFGTPDGSKKRDRLHIGFLAQEAMEVEKKHGYASKKDDMLIVNQDENEENPSYGYKYERLVPVLVNAIKELSAKNDALEARLEALES